MRLGYNPIELRPTPVKAFRSPELTEQMVRTKAEHFEEKRQAKIEAVKQERRSIVKMLDAGQAINSPLRTGVLGATSAPIVGAGTAQEAQAAKAKMVENDMKRFEAAKARQRKELERLVEGEMKLNELTKKLEITEAKAEERKMTHEEKVKKRQAKIAEKQEKRKQELQMRMEIELENRKKLAISEAGREKAIVEKEVEDLKMHKTRMVENDMLARAKIEAHQKKIDDLIKLQEDLAKQSRADMDRREAQLKAVMEKSQEKRAKARALKQAKTAKRIAIAAEKNRKIQEDKRTAYEKRVAEAEVLKKEKKMEEMDYIAKVVKTKAEKDAVRTGRLEDAKAGLAAKKEKIVQDRLNREAKMSAEREVRESKTWLSKIDKDMHLEDKLENVARIRRVEEFERLKLMQKIQLDDDRSERIKQERAYLMEQRHLSAHEAFLTRLRVREAMEQMRISNKSTGLEGILDGGKKKRNKNADEGGTTQSP